MAGNTRDKFSSRIGFIFASMGFAIGVGTFWRFPFLCGQYGGAAFLVLYIAAIALIAVPLLTLELAMGAATQSGPVGAYRSIAGKYGGWKLNAWVNVLAMFLLMGYTTPVGAWILAYIPRAAIGTFSGMSASEIADYWNVFLGRQGEIIAWIVAMLTLIAVIIRRDLNAGLEKANKFCMQTLLVILVILCIRSVTLPGAGAGIEFFLKPDWSKVTITVVLAAVSQAFYAIGVAMAVGIVFGSYMKEEDKNILGNAATVGISIIGVGLLAGFMIFPSVFAFGLEPAAGPGLTFITMPNVFNQMPLGNVFATLFYILFFLAALSSWLGGFEAIISTVKDEFGIPREKAVWIVAVAVLCVAIPSSLSGVIFEKLDFLVSNVLLIFGALLGAIFGGWVWGMTPYAKQCKLEDGSLKLKILAFIIRIVSPIVIVVLALTTFGLLK